MRLPPSLVEMGWGEVQMNSSSRTEPEDLCADASRSPEDRSIGPRGSSGPTWGEILAEEDRLKDVLRKQRDAVKAEAKRLVEALEEIRDLKPEEYQFPADWSEQIEACEECQRYRDHPIQRGICDRHRRPIWDRESHESREEKRIGWRAKDVARQALLCLADGEGTSSTSDQDRHSGRNNQTQDATNNV